MIPLEYRLREPVRLESAGGGTWRVVCEEPLTVLTVNTAAARLLKRTRHGAAVADLAQGLAVPEERIFELCEYFRSRGVLDVRRASVDAVPGVTAVRPSVTVIVPVLDRAEELGECLAALASVDYPSDRLEVVVVDDGSEDGGAVARAAARYGARLLTNERNRGPSFSRNRAASVSTAEILAFVDSDCVPERSWLSDLAPYFSWDTSGSCGRAHGRLLHRLAAEQVRRGLLPAGHGTVLRRQGERRGHLLRADLQSTGPPLRVRSGGRSARGSARGRGCRPVLASSLYRLLRPLRARGDRPPQASRPSRRRAAPAGAVWDVRSGSLPTPPRQAQAISLGARGTRDCRPGLRGSGVP